MSDIDMITILDHICTTCIDFCKLLIKSFKSHLHLAESKRIEFSKAFLSLKDSPPFSKCFFFCQIKAPPE
jgi:hypothetical protein